MDNLKQWLHIAKARSLEHMISSLEHNHNLQVGVKLYSHGTESSIYDESLTVNFRFQIKVRNSHELRLSHFVKVYSWSTHDAPEKMHETEVVLSR